MVCVCRLVVQFYCERRGKIIVGNMVPTKERRERSLQVEIDGVCWMRIRIDRNFSNFLEICPRFPNFLNTKRNKILISP